MEVVRDGGADHLARCLANMPDKQAAALTAIESLGQKHAEEQTTERNGRTKRSWSFTERKKHRRFSRRGAPVIRVSFPESWLEWGLGAEGDQAPRTPEADILAAHDAVTTNSTKAQKKLGKLVNQGRHAAHTALIDQLPETSRPQGPGDPLGRCETKPLANCLLYTSPSPRD